MKITWPPKVGIDDELQIIAQLYIHALSPLTSNVILPESSSLNNLLSDTLWLIFI